MKDVNGDTLVEGDLVMLTIDTPVERVGEIIIYLANEERTISISTEGVETNAITNTVKYYPLSDEGLEVAKYDNDNVTDTMYRSKKFNVTNVEAKHLLKVKSGELTGYNKTLYDNISAEI